MSSPPLLSRSGRVRKSTEFYKAPGVPKAKRSAKEAKIDLSLEPESKKQKSPTTKSEPKNGKKAAAKKELKKPIFDPAMIHNCDARSIILALHESKPDVKTWDSEDVYKYFMLKAPEFAPILWEKQINGDALLVINPKDILSHFNLKLGYAMRLYIQIVQHKNNNPEK